MDVKALAKSKRAHTLQHSRKNPPPSSKKSSIGSEEKKKTSGNQSKEKPPQFQVSRHLPSNWDRYNDDDASGSVSEEAQTGSVQQSLEFVAPKSKGADYAYLLSEAKAQAQPQVHRTTNAFPFSDDGFGVDFGSMLAERGESLFSWIQDDDFDFDGEGGSDFQVPFLSLNLDSLADRLAKSKPSERLFIEPGLIQERLDKELPEEKSSSSSSSSISLQMKDGRNSEFERRRDQESVSQQQRVKNPSSEASNLESELDMLLNSFGEASLFEPSSSSSEEVKYSAAAAESGDNSYGAVSKSKLLEDFDSWLDTI
ncbi:hypothetical protein M569_15881 [Genlisea aurea]|uniref:Uncharacterized protein n=1 Tax=Genlisea aurea TaxID=192259 RepID=S8C3J2_9LAMI|nr:hypothetical protein M569_15881 [Genlisea aurea]